MIASNNRPASPNVLSKGYDMYIYQNWIINGMVPRIRVQKAVLRFTARREILLARRLEP